MDTTKTITHLSLCSGYEGIGLGIRRVFPNVREVAHVEIEAFAAANLVAKMEEGKLDAAPIWTNLKTFPFSEFHGKVDILSGGFPCQPFSAAGKRLASEDPRHLFPFIEQGIRDCEPGIVFLENVEGIISAKMPDEKSVLQYVLDRLEGLGYRTTAGVFSASEVGASHQRKRVFILGYTNNKGSQRFRGASELKIPKERERKKRYPSSTSRQFPSRPNEPQYEWEAPRVLNPLNTRDGWGEQFEEVSKESRSLYQEQPTQRMLGGTNDGLRDRVDRLRLLGNGVVPATAEKAFRTLFERIA